MKAWRIVGVVCVAVLVVGCGGGGGDTGSKSSGDTNAQATAGAGSNGTSQSGGSSNQPEDNGIKMQQGKVYDLQKGDKIVKKSSDATVEIVTDTKEKRSTVTLLQGKATLLRQ